MKRYSTKKILLFLLKLLLTGAILFASYLLAIIILLCGASYDLWIPLIYAAMLLLPGLTIPLLYIKKRKSVLLVWSAYLAVLAISIGINIGINEYDKSITVNTAPNIVL